MKTHMQAFMIMQWRYYSWIATYYYYYMSQSSHLHFSPESSVSRCYIKLLYYIGYLYNSWNHWNIKSVNPKLVILNFNKIKTNKVWRIYQKEQGTWIFFFIIHRYVLLWCYSLSSPHGQTPKLATKYLSTSFCIIIRTTIIVMKETHQLQHIDIIIKYKYKYKNIKIPISTTKLQTSSQIW